MVLIDLSPTSEGFYSFAIVPFFDVTVMIRLYSKMFWKAWKGKF